jgi:ribosomal protein L22
MAWFEKRKEKKLLKKIDANSHSLYVSSSDILIKMISSARANGENNILVTGNGLKEDVLEIEDVESISF